MHLRPIRPDDEARLLGALRAARDESLYLRFFSPVPAPDRRAARAPHDRRLRRRTWRSSPSSATTSSRSRATTAPGADEAEVAFTVQDDQQGRGLATLLLEHLAAVARSNGITTFVADTLPNNRAMLDVFARRGLGGATATFADGTVHVRFPIEPTDGVDRGDRSARAAAPRPRRSRALLAPRSIAVIGASRRAGHDRPRGVPQPARVRLPGPGVPGEPDARRRSRACARTRRVLDVPDTVDLAVVVVPAAAVPDVVDECAQKRRARRRDHLGRVRRGRDRAGGRPSRRSSRPRAATACASSGRTASAS